MTSAVDSWDVTLSGPLGDLVGALLRTRPRRQRAIASVARVMSAAAGVILCSCRPEEISIERISSIACVTPQAIYRYFNNVEGLIVASLRCSAANGYARMAEALSEQMMSDLYGMASRVVDALLLNCEEINHFPIHHQKGIQQAYRQIGVEGSLIISALMGVGVAHDVRRSLGFGRVAAAFSAVVAVATSPAFATALASRPGDAKRTLTHVFLAALQSIGDGFDEKGETAFDVAGSEARLTRKGLASATSRPALAPQPASAGPLRPPAPR